MSTDFFTSQDDARKQTGRLVAMFIFGVLGTMLSVWLVAIVPIALAGADRNGGKPNWAAAFGNWQALLTVMTIVGAIVGIATLVKLAQLSQGGEKIAEMLGGVRIDPATRDREERAVLDIVEEMSIASGVPVPPVYLMETGSINAFAAGPDPSRSVIGVTRGCIHLLSRDELQGVIAHEYSHIFHGDTRINARTTAVIAGIMAVGVIGYICFRYIGPSLARSRGGKNNPGPAIGAGLIVGGLLIWAIGSIGMLFGRMIQAAISRQREFLADASAVQYTRNPDGIGGALAKIRDHYSARVASPAASELNHFFFCSSLDTLLATHPPIDERIKRIVAMGAVRLGAREAVAASIAPRSTPAARAKPAAGQPTAALAGFTSDAVAAAGTLDPAAIDRVHAWKSALPTALIDAAHDSVGARALCYLIARRAAGHDVCDRLIAADDREAYASYAALAAPVAELRADMQLALAELAAPALFALGIPRYRKFREVLARTMQSDGRVDLREWSLAKCLERNVERRFAKNPASADARLEILADEARTVLATIAATEQSGDSAARAFARGYNAMGLQSPSFPDTNIRSLDALNAAVLRLATLRFADRARFLNACAAAAAHDGGVTESEHLVVRSVADALDVPLPALAAAN